MRSSSQMYIFELDFGKRDCLPAVAPLEKPHHFAGFHGLISYYDAKITFYFKVSRCLPDFAPPRKGIE